MCQREVNDYILLMKSGSLKRQSERRASGSHHCATVTHSQPQVQYVPRAAAGEPVLIMYERVSGGERRPPSRPVGL